MIRLNELRIGNWSQQEINGSIDYFQLDRVKDLIDVSVFGDPIPITLEILEKCGFESGKETNINGLIQYDFWKTKNIPHLHRWLLYKDGEYIIYKNNILIGRAYIKYLHQLQNLYFALTGEELTVNL